MSLLISILFALSFASAAAPSKVRVGASPVMSSAGIFLAQDLGYFKAQNLDVEITAIANSGAPMTLLLANDKLDVGAGNLTAGLFHAIAKGEGIRVVADKGHVGKNG